MIPTELKTFYPLTIMSNGGDVNFSSVVVNGKPIPQTKAISPFMGVAFIMANSDDEPVVTFYKIIPQSANGFTEEHFLKYTKEMAIPGQSYRGIFLVWTQGLDAKSWGKTDPETIAWLKSIGAGPEFQDIEQKITQLPTCVGDASYSLASVVKIEKDGKVTGLDTSFEVADSGYYPNAGLSLSLVPIDVNKKTLFELRELD